MINGITYIEDFLPRPDDVFTYLKDNVKWDESMASRKTASYGVAYNYSQMQYPFQAMLPVLEEICNSLNPVIGYQPNNCLINYYADGKSKMGFHSDQIDILCDGTGVAIVSLGETRILRFRNIEDKDEVFDFELISGSLLYMSQEVQMAWEHAILKSDTRNPRISLTLRKIK